MLKGIDKTLGTFLCWLVAHWCRAKRKFISNTRLLLNAEDNLNILIIKLCCLGDAVLLIPTLRNLRKNYPLSSITVLTTYRTSNLFDTIPYVNQVIYFPLTRNPLTILRFILNVKKQNFDIVFSFDPWYRIATLLSFILKPKINVGFFYTGLPFLSHIFAISSEYTEEKHVVETYLDLLKLMNLDITDSRLEFFVDLNSFQFADKFFIENGLSSPVIGIFPGSSERWASKRWPASRYAQVADALITQLGAKILLLSGKGQGDIVREIFTMMQGRAIIAPENTSVSQLAALLAKCDLVISNDSAPMHIAAAVDTPTIAIFSNVSPVAYHPWIEPYKYIVVRKNMPCSPCVKFGNMPSCYFQYRCIQEISIEDVITAVLQIWPYIELRIKSKSVKVDEQ